MTTKARVYRFECGTLRFSVEADNEEHAWALAEDFISTNGTLGMDIDHLAYDGDLVHDAVVYPDITDGLSLVDTPEGVCDPPKSRS